MKSSQSYSSNKFITLKIKKFLKLPLKTIKLQSVMAKQKYKPRNLNTFIFFDVFVLMENFPSDDSF